MSSIANCDVLIGYSVRRGSGPSRLVYAWLNSEQTSLVMMNNPGVRRAGVQHIVSQHSAA